MRRTLTGLLTAQLALVGCHAQWRVDAARIGYARRAGGNWVEAAMPAVEVGPGGPTRQSVTGAATARFLWGREDEGRIEGAAQLRVHLWRAHDAMNNWRRTDETWDPSNPLLRRRPCGDHTHVERYVGRAYVERFSTGVLLEGHVGATGRWIPDGYDSRGRPRSRFEGGEVAGGGAAGVFVRAIMPWWMSFSAEGGWEYADGRQGPFVRANLGMTLDLSVDRAAPRMVERD